MLHPIKLGDLTLSSNIFIAPLAGYTNLPTRRFYRGQGAGIAYAEMVSAEGLNYNFDKSVKLIDSGDMDTPLGVQLFGSNADRILMAFGLIKSEKFELIDVNCGCSVKKIIRSGCGATLLTNPEEIYKIIKGLKNETDKPVTLKIRSGWDHNSINYMEVYDAAYQGGAALITLHPRTKSMLFSGRADWSHIKDLKQKSSIPVIGNGDIFTPEDAVDMFEQTNCDGIMLARGLIENPFLVEATIAKLSGTTYIERSCEERLELAKAHLSSFIEYMDSEVKGVLEFRKFFRGFVKGLPNISVLKQVVNTSESYEEISLNIKKYLDYNKALV